MHFPKQPVDKSTTFLLIPTTYNAFTWQWHLPATELKLRTEVYRLAFALVIAPRPRDSIRSCTCICLSSNSGFLAFPLGNGAVKAKSPGRIQADPKALAAKEGLRLTWRVQGAAIQDPQHLDTGGSPGAEKGTMIQEGDMPFDSTSCSGT